MIVDAEKAYIPIEMRNEKIIYLASIPYFRDQSMWADFHHLSLKAA
jgi:hypothetical protein